MALDLNALKAKVKAHQDKKGGGAKEYPPTVFLPEGTHKVRFITDPNDEVFVEYWSYGYFAKGIRDPLSADPSLLPEGFVNELKEIGSKMADYRKYSYNAKYNMIVYAYLYDTDSKTEDWQPGNLYALVCNRKFADAYINFISTLAADAPEAILDILNPTKPGILLNLQYKHGKDGSCSIGAAFPTKHVDPIDIGSIPYISLDECYIKPGFSIERYNTLLEKYRTDLKVAEEAAAAYRAANGTADLPPPPETPTTEATGESMIPASTSAPVPTDAPTQPPSVDPAVNEAPFDGGVKVKAPADMSGSSAASEDPWARFRQ